MARTKNNGNGKLDEAMQMVLQTQAIMQQSIATLVQTQATFVAEKRELDRQIAETNRINSERFAHIDEIFAEIIKMLEALPEAVRDKIGFKAPEKPEDLRLRNQLAQHA